MNESRTAPAKYVFLDIVGYTNNRTVEAQSDLISKVNNVVTTALTNFEINSDQIILLPTGDGICIALIAIMEPYDIHIQLALMILSLIEDYNDSTTDKMRKFQVRIGINENVDNLVTDVNGNQNVAGTGINMAQRIMGYADGGQILVSQTVFNQLEWRESYISRFTQFQATFKHGINSPVYQYINQACQGLNTLTPKAFKKHRSPLTDMLAYYLSYAIKYNDDLIKYKESIQLVYAGPIIIYLLAQDTISLAETTPYDEQYRTLTWGAGQVTFDQIWDYYCAIDFSVLTEFSELIKSMYLNQISDCFEKRRSLSSYVFVNECGKRRLREERPDIWSKITPS